MAINKRGLVMNGLKRASGNTAALFRGYVQIAYDTDTGDIYTRYHADLGSWTRWDDNNIITVGGTRKHMTMQEIADKVYNAVTMLGLYA